MKFFVLVLTTIYSFSLSAQKIEILTEYNNTSIRGLSVVNDKIIWVSGSHGTVGKSVDSGRTWHWITVKNFEQNDFRDIEAFDEKKAIIMSVGEPAYILKTIDGGDSWKIVFADSTKGMFLDAMDFADEAHGMVVGDPINNQTFLAYTKDQGNTWKITNSYGLYRLSEGEALFASSGTNIKMLPDRDDQKSSFVFVTGGKKSRAFFYSPGQELNMIQGEQSQGANSIAINQNKGVIVGGDFLRDTISKGNCVLFTLNSEGIDFETPSQPPWGYKSCVEYITENNLICCGTSGVDLSDDGGKHWKHISNISFHVCKRAKTGNSVFLAGINGKIGILK
ncbi:MAG: oxidoreductase [Bacteroidetes bacterium]|nr:oxidoreductase [Bacteroidota bacterium]